MKMNIFLLYVHRWGGAYVLGKILLSFKIKKNTNIFRQDIIIIKKNTYFFFILLNKKKYFFIILSWGGGWFFQKIMPLYLKIGWDFQIRRVWR